MSTPYQISHKEDKTKRLAEYKDLCKGLTNAEIGEVLGWKASSVRTYKSQNPNHPYYFKCPPLEKIEQLRAYIDAKESK